MRPAQWVKNGLIVIAPASAGILTHADVIRHTGVAFVSFCLIASAGYLMNDLRDVAADKEHPTKRYRAIASGQLRAKNAWLAAAVLLAVGFSLPLFLWRPWGLLREPVYRIQRAAAPVRGR